MSTEKQIPEENQEPPIGLGRRYSSVGEFLKNGGFSEETKAAMREMKEGTRIVDKLVYIRHAAGITQEKMADILGVNQSTISKLENGDDVDLTIGQIRAYAEATSERLGITFGKPLESTDQIIGHAMAMRRLMLELTKFAHEGKDFETSIHAFFGDVAYNVFRILKECQERLPGERVFEVQLEVLEGKVNLPNPTKTACEPAVLREGVLV